MIHLLVSLDIVINAFCRNGSLSFVCIYVRSVWRIIQLATIDVGWRGRSQGSRNWWLWSSIRAADHSLEGRTSPLEIIIISYQKQSTKTVSGASGANTGWTTR